MKPIKKLVKQGNFLKPWLPIVLNPKNELYQLASQINWSSLEQEFESLFEEKKGAPAKPVRLVVGLMMLQHMFNYSDEGVVEEWVENPYWQYFCGEKQLRWEKPIHPSSLPRWRKRIGTDGMNKILAESVKTALKTGTASAKSLAKVIADTTVMEKNITYPTDSKTQYNAIKLLVKMAKGLNIPLRQTYIYIGKKTLIKSCRYSHARQMKRAKKERQKLKTYLGRLYRDIHRKISDSEILQSVFKNIFEIIEKLLSQVKDSKNKIYSIYEPHVECIAKGKVHKKYEFGCKTSIVITHKEGLILQAAALHGNPFDGHTLKNALEEAEDNSNKQIDQVYADKGYKGHGIKDRQVFISGQSKGVTSWFKKQLKRRQAIEPHIGHMKSDGKLGRNYLKGKLGDQLHAALCGIGHNLRMIARKLGDTSAVPT